MYIDFVPAGREQMGEKNNVLNVYMSNPKRIQSVVEFCIKKKLPENWYLSCNDAEGFYSVENENGKKTFRQRDVFKKIITETGFFYLGIENQENINLIFPWRLMQMDCLEYGRQIEEIQRVNKEKKSKYKKEDDFLYAFKQQDRLIPILNIVLYWGKTRWKSPKSLRDMIGESNIPTDMKKLFKDYKVYLIHVRFIPDKLLNKMDSDLRYVLGLIKREGNKEKCKKYIMDNKTFFSNIPQSAMDVLNVYMNMKEITGSKEYISKINGEEYVDMCKAIEDWKKEMIREGLKEGRQESKMEDIRKLMKNLKISSQRAMELLEIPIGEQKKYLKLIN